MQREQVQLDVFYAAKVTPVTVVWQALQTVAQDFADQASPSVQK